MSDKTDAEPKVITNFNFILIKILFVIYTCEQENKLIFNSTSFL